MTADPEPVPCGPWCEMPREPLIATMDDWLDLGRRMAREHGIPERHAGPVAALLHAGYQRADPGGFHWLEHASVDELEITKARLTAWLDNVDAEENTP